MLKVTLRPHECIIVNGCVIRNGDRRQALFRNSTRSASCCGNSSGVFSPTLR